jgi:coiled-coil domain-containing protein 61
MSAEAITPTVDDEFDAILAGIGHKYRFTAKLSGSDLFAVQIVNEDFTQRWSGTYSANYVDDMTQKAGCTKKLSVFWRMMRDSIGESSMLSLEVLTSQEIQNLSHFKLIPEPDDRLFVLLTQKSEYDCFRFPLPLKSVPYSSEELVATIRLLYQDNRDMKRAFAAADCMGPVLAIEKKCEKLQELVKEVQKQKDMKICALKKKVKMLKAKLNSAAVC